MTATDNKDAQKGPMTPAETTEEAARRVLVKHEVQNEYIGEESSISSLAWEMGDGGTLTIETTLVELVQTALELGPTAAADAELRLERIRGLLLRHYTGSPAFEKTPPHITELDALADLYDEDVARELRELLTADTPVVATPVLDPEDAKHLIDVAERGLAHELGQIDVRNHYTEDEQRWMTSRWDGARRAIAAIKEMTK